MRAATGAIGAAGGPRPALAEPRTVIAEMVSSLEPMLTAAVVDAAITAAAPTRARQRTLATALERCPDLLTSARAEGPRSVEVLIRRLLADGATSVAPPRCADCQGERPLTRVHEGRRICAVCSNRRSRAECGNCGRMATVAYLGRGGEPLCDRCEPRGLENPVGVVSDAIAALEPHLEYTAIVEMVGKIASSTAARRSLAWEVVDNPALLTGSGARGTPLLIHLIEAALVLGARTIVMPPCPLCGLDRKLSNRQDDGSRCCARCYNQARAEPCTRCDRRMVITSRSLDGQALCAACYQADAANFEPCDSCGRVGTIAQRIDGRGLCRICQQWPIAVCTVCGRNRPCTGTTKGSARCGACLNRMRTVKPCSVCGKTRRPRRNLADGRALCRSCAELKEQCAGCGKVRWVTARRADGAALCKVCFAKDPSSWRECTRCGTVERLFHFGLCHRCSAQDAVGRLLGDEEGRVRDELGPVLAALKLSDAKGILTWLREPEPRTVLAEIGAAEGPVTHATLDQLTPSKSVEFVRAVLVAGGALPPREQALAVLERWVPTALAKVGNTQDRKVVHGYVRWHHLRRLRRRPEGRPITTEHTGRIRGEVHAAVHLLNWLNERGSCLAECTQSDIDLWAAEKPPRYFEARSFVKWAVEHRHARGIEVPTRRRTESFTTIGEQERWRQIRRLIDDGSLHITDRVAGLLILMFAQPLNGIIRITVDQITEREGTVLLALGREPVELPPPVDQLVLQLLRRRRGHAVVGRDPSTPWLFPGGRAGQPLSPQGMLKRLKRLGIHTRPARTAALMDMARDLPAPVLSNLLGISLFTATRWHGESGGDGAGYAAEVSRRG